MSLELFKGGHPRVSKMPRISLSKRGYFGMNSAAYHLLGGPSRIVFLYDGDRELVGLKPAEEDTPHSYKVVRQGESRSYVVAAKAFCDSCGIRYGDEVRAFTPRNEDDLLVFEIGGQEG